MLLRNIVLGISFLTAGDPLLCPFSFNNVQAIPLMKRLYSSLNERLTYVYIRDLQMPMRTALGMNTQR